MLVDSTWEDGTVSRTVRRIALALAVASLVGPSTASAGDGVCGKSELLPGCSFCAAGECVATFCCETTGKWWGICDGVPNEGNC